MPLNRTTKLPSFLNIVSKALSLTLIVSTAIGSAAFSLPAVAQEKNSGMGHKKSGSQWGLGVAAVSNQKAYSDISRDTMLVPFVTYENEYVKWFGASLSFKLPSYTISPSQQLKFNVIAEYDLGSGYDDSEARDTSILNGMEDRSGAFAAGAKIEWSNPWVDMNMALMSDVSGDRDGTRVSLGFEKKWMLGQKVMISPRVKLTWQDDSFVDYHYGVRANEVRSDREFYAGSSALNVEYGLMTAYMFDKQNSIMLNLGVTSLGSAIKDSPLVDSSTENNIFMVYMYKF